MKSSSYAAKSLKLLWKNIRQFPLLAAVDTAGIIAFLYVLFYAAEQIKAIFDKMMNLADAMNAGLSSSIESAEELTALAGNEAQIMAYYNDAIKYVILIFAAMYVCWVISQSINWYLTEKKIFGRKINFRKYFVKFAVLSLAWTAILIIGIVLFAQLWSYVVMAPEGMISTAVPKVMFAAFLIVLLYFEFISYAAALKSKSILDSFKKTFVIAAEKYQKLAWPYLLMGFIFLIEWEIFFYVMAVSMNFVLELMLLSVLAVYILILATLSWARILAIELLEK